MKKKLISKEGNFFDMLNRRANSLVQETSNCMGTALYLVGEMDEDKDLSGPHEEILKNLTPLSEPTLGCLVGWKRGKKTYHLGVITSINPLLITNRHGSYKHGGGLLFKNEPFRQTKSMYDKFLGKIVYFIPSKLESELE